jgi:hypothetical protein
MATVCEAWVQGPKILDLTAQSGADASALPDVADAFDSILAIDAIGEGQDWLEALRGWAAKARSGGRVLFNGCALDHLERYGVTPGSQKRQALLAASDIRVVADQLGMRIVEVVPLCALDAGKFAHPADGRPLSGQYWWKRALSWAQSDEQLAAFCRFLERKFFARMPMSLSPNFVAIFEKQADPVANRTWFERHLAMNEAIAGNIHFQVIAPYLIEPKAWQTELQDHLRHTRNRVLFHHLWMALWANAPSLDVASFLPDGQGQLPADWAHREVLDMWVTALAQTWHQQEPFRQNCLYREIDLGPMTDYNAINKLLTACLNRQS